MAAILIADDDDSLGALMTRALEKDGHAVRYVSNGGEALALIEIGSEPDLLVADISMPVVDGLELAEKVLARATQVKILMISAMPERLEAAQALDTLRVQTLQKPFSLDALKAQVATFLRT